MCGPGGALASTEERVHSVDVEHERGNVLKPDSGGGGDVQLWISLESS